jgi:hypothetical protein
MTTIRRRSTALAFAFLATALAACANDPTSPFDDAQRVNATTDSTGRKEPTLPWYSVQKLSDSTSIVEPTLPWYRAEGEPTLPWYKKTAEPTLPWY